MYRFISKFCVGHCLVLKLDTYLAEIDKKAQGITE